MYQLYISRDTIILNYQYTLIGAGHLRLDEGWPLS